MNEHTNFDKPKMGQAREKAEDKFLAFGGYEPVTQEARDGLVQIIMGSVDKKAIRKAQIASILPPYLKKLSNNDVQTWIKRNFVEDKYEPTHKDRMRILKKRARKGDKTAILIVSMFGEGGNLNHYDIVDRWAHIEETAKLTLANWKQDIKGEHGTVNSDDWNEEMQGQVSGLVRIVNEEIQGIREQLDDADSSLKQEFESYVQSLREKRQAERKQYLASHNVDVGVQLRLTEVKHRIEEEIDGLIVWQREISKSYKAGNDRFGPEAITISNYRQKESIDSNRGFSGQVHVDLETGDLTLDLGQTGHIFASPPKFSGLRPYDGSARMEFEVKEVHPDGQEEKYTISMGFDGEDCSKPFLQFVCTETDQVSDKIYFGPGARLNMMMVVRKPVIYLYSDKNINAKVKVDYDGKFTTVYPDFKDNSEWVVKTLENGLLECQSRVYPYLFWEGVPNTGFNKDFDEGFCVKRDGLKEFLEDKLVILGLNAKEQTDFITYWLPVLERNEFNIIQFCVEEYEEKAKLMVEPKPDQLIRIFMKFKAMDNYEKIKEQELTGVERKDNGFVVVEWGGVDLGGD